MKETLFSKLNGWIDKYIKVVNFVFGLFIGMIIINKYGWNFILNWKLEFNPIFIEYLKIIFNYPSVLLIITLTLFTKFYSSIDYFIRNLSIKYKDAQISAQQSSNSSPNSQTSKAAEDAVILSKQDAQEIAGGIENLQSENSTKQKQIEELQNLVSQLADRSEYFEFLYLNYYLVVNTKLVLKQLNNGGAVTKDLFIQNIFVPLTLVDQYAEKLAIHSALLINGLIEDDSKLIKISEKGIRYLKSINLL